MPGGVKGAGRGRCQWRSARWGHGAKSGGQGERAGPGARRPEVRLPSAWNPDDGSELEPDGDYDGLEFREADFVGQDGGGATFMDCA